MVILGIFVLTILSSALPAIAVVGVVCLLISVPSSSAQHTSSKSTTRTLEDTKPRRRNNSNKEYQFCYMDGTRIIKIGSKMNWYNALIALGVTNTTLDYTISRNINLSNLSESGKTVRDSRLPWGIFADSQVAAKTLALALGYNRPPEVHKSGHYGHYHDNNYAHHLHIWYGKQIIY